MLYRIWNAEDLQELVRLLEPIGNQSDHSAFDLHHARFCPLTQMLGHDVVCEIRKSSSETHVSGLRDVAVHMLAALDLQVDAETPEECVIDLLVSTRTVLDTLRFLCAPEIGDDLHLEPTTSNLEEISSTSEITHRNSVVGNNGCAIDDSHILDSSFQSILENKSNFKNDGPNIKAALQKLAKLLTITGVGVAKYSEAVDEAMALIEKYKPSMYPQTTAVK